MDEERINDEDMTGLVEGARHAANQGVGEIHGGCDRADHQKRGKNEGVNVQVIMKFLMSGQSNDSDILPTATKLEEKASVVVAEEVTERMERRWRKSRRG